MFTDMAMLVESQVQLRECFQTFSSGIVSDSLTLFHRSISFIAFNNHIILLISSLEEYLVHPSNGAIFF